MVATRTDPGTEAHAPTAEETPTFARYERPYDLTAAGAEDGPGGVMYVPLVTHASYNRGQPFTRRQKREALIKQAALRIIAGLETRSLRTLAKDIGCGHVTIHKSVMRFCQRLGLRPMGGVRLRGMRKAHEQRLAAMEKV